MRFPGRSLRAARLTVPHVQQPAVIVILCASARECEADMDQPGSIRFWGTDVAELYTKEIAESYKGVLAKNFVSKPDGEFPTGFVHASPIPQGWSGTFWTRDGGTFLREMTLWGYTNHARLTAEYLMKYIEPNEEGFYCFPEYFERLEEGQRQRSSMAPPRSS